MKQLAVILILVTAMASRASMADSAKAAALTEAQKRQIAWAIEVLANDDVVKMDQDHCATLDPDLIKKLTNDQRDQLTEAIEVLADNGVMYKDQNQCAAFDSDIIKELMDEGLLKQGDSKLMSICIGLAR